MKFFFLFVLFFNHLGIPTVSFAESFMDICLDLAKKMLIYNFCKSSIQTAETSNHGSHRQGLSLP